MPNLVCQFSSIGTMGPNESAWLGKEFINSLCPKLGVNFSNKCPERFICVNIYAKYIYFKLFKLN